MTSATLRQDRIAARVPHHIYETLCHAAALSGATVNQFLVQAALKEAQQIIEREQQIQLSARDWQWLLELLEHPPAANARLQAALNRYPAAQHADHRVDGSP